ncbi:hypothetical protein LSTR_LSTR008118 [Laodelphax striatellus]|uniref:C2H2-type domain-containing protein n=1 Tax=Laodelphax striatellus TaxID=195883 RepID=A0A482XBC1_LAOST|nr:hypothetical protein LSTR_LSTR008118 [Laodelphax striatellus]
MFPSTQTSKVKVNQDPMKGCNRRFTEYSSLCKHHSSHSKSNECEICGKVFTRVATLAIHKQTAHNLFEAEQGTEFHVSNLAGLDSKKVKNVLSTVLSSLEKDDSSFVTLQSTVDQLTDGIDDQNQIFILTEDNLDETLQVMCPSRQFQIEIAGSRSRSRHNPSRLYSKAVCPRSNCYLIPVSTQRCQMTLADRLTDYPKNSQM